MASRKSVRRSIQWTAARLTKHFLKKGAATRSCPGLNAPLGPATKPVAMERVLGIGKKLSGISQQVIDDREDRV